ncbi:MAG: potassium-transporting ATPase subunit F [Conexibacteraceae bacterium]|nr:potassium-transporting ATPase subunit F [Conexibacteraceae bacterium]
MEIAAISGADIFGLVATVLVCAYLLYALLRGERF